MIYNRFFVSCGLVDDEGKAIGEYIPADCAKTATLEYLRRHPGVDKSIVTVSMQSY